MIREVELLASAARTVTGSGTAVDIGAVGAGAALPTQVGAVRGRFFLDVTAASGTTPTLDVTIVGTINGREFTIVTFTQTAAVTQEEIALETVPDSLRVDFTIGGTTPSFTFSVDAVLQLD